MQRLLPLGLSISLLGCTLFVRPQPQQTLVEQALGGFTFNDSADSFSGRFILHAYEGMLAVDLYAFAFPAAMVRYFTDSTLVYLPTTGQLLVMGEERGVTEGVTGGVTGVGWKVPIKPLADAYWGRIPGEPDSVTEVTDTVYYWKDATAYLRLSGDRRFLGITGADWSLAREGELEGAPDRAARLVFRTKDAEFVLEFTSLELKELEPKNIFTLNLPGDVERLDLR